MLAGVETEKVGGRSRPGLGAGAEDGDEVIDAVVEAEAAPPPPPPAPAMTLLRGVRDRAREWFLERVLAALLMT